jgi:hypothetical protein
MNYLLRSGNIKALVAFLGSAIFSNTVNAQATIYKDNQVINTVTTAVPFLRINPDARAGGMGDVGIATPTDANGFLSNPSKMAFIEKDFGFAVSFTPWLKSLVNDIYMADLTGYYKVKKMQTIGVGIKFFSLGNITFTDINGTETGQGRPNEFSIDVHYARKLGNNFGLAASLRYIYSNLATGQTNPNGDGIRAGNAGAGDISWYFNKNFKKDGEKISHDLHVGMNLSNIGSKISYTSNVVKDFIPANLGIGLGYTLNIDEKNGIGFYMDFNKLLAPSPVSMLIDSVGANGEVSGQVRNPKYDQNNNGIADFREKSSIGGLFTSFGDAPGTAYMNSNGEIKYVKGSRVKEEFREITIGVGAEYLYNKQFGVRFGYFYEPRTKGARQFLTAGLTVKYSVVGLNFSYLIPTSIQRNPLDNTLRFSLLFEFANGGKKSGNNSGVSLVPDEPKKDKKKAAPEPVEQKPIQKQFEPIEPK